MWYRRLCKKHPTYAAKRAPRSKCAECWQAYRKERKVSEAVARAADTLLALLGVPVTVTAEFRRKDSDVCAIKVHAAPVTEGYL